MIVKTTDGKIIGNLDKGVFTKTVKGSFHKLLTPPAWAIDAYVFDHVLRGRCRLIVVIDREDKRRYTADFATFEAHKGTINRRYGNQYFLTMDWWN